MKLGDEDALLRQGRRGDHRHRLMRIEVGVHEGGGNLLEIAQTHIEHDGLAGLRERSPIDGVFLIAAMTGHQDQRLAHAAQSGRDRSDGQRGKPRGDAWDDAEGNAGGG